MSEGDRRRGQSRILEVMSAASLGLAVGFAVWSFAATMSMAAKAGLSGLAGISAFLLAARLLCRLADGPGAAVRMAKVKETDPAALLLRLQDMLAEASAAEQGAKELLLDDALPAAEPDSRVVRLFRAPEMPTAGELRTRIDRHLVSRGGAPGPATDHSGELFEALESLKRSLG